MLAHIYRYSAVAREEFVRTTSYAVGSVSQCEKVAWIHISEPKENLVSQDQVMLQTSDIKTFQFNLASLSA